MHHIYQTEGFVIGGTNAGEANRYLKIFTLDFGMISGSAQGIRHLKSKLRYSLQDFSYSSVSLVKGKDVWRVVNAEKKENLWELFRKEKRKLEIFARSLSLLKRFLHGEEKNEALFRLFSSSCFYLAKSETLSPEDLRNFEYVLVLRILHNLGYLKKLPILSPFSETDAWNQDILREMEGHKALALAEINRSFTESHL
ncbi:MAG: DNA repair protein RecO [Candidatus Pacebacteria bacterium]|nr:DNA repair protein RecO [Candidatus Paceibacterota bacterium]